MGCFLPLLTIGSYAALVVILTRMYGGLLGLAATAGIVVMLSFLTAWLLSSSQLNAIGWKNRLAALLLPWGWLVGGGRLVTLIGKNAGISFAFAVVVVGIDRTDLLEPAFVQEGEQSFVDHWLPIVLVWLTAIGWILFALGWILLILHGRRQGTEPISTLVLRKNKAVPLILPPIAVGVSIVFRYIGWYWLALAIVWIPLVVIFLPVILMMLTLGVYSLLGKPIRWN